MDIYVEKLNDYLPIDFGDDDNNEYRKYLFLTYKENCMNAKYQFALMAYHMLFMSFMYKEFWGLKNYNFEVVKKLCESNNKFASIDSIFELSLVPELTTIDSFLGVLNWHPNKKSAVKEFVNKRDHCAHASGFVQYERDSVERHLLEVLDYTRKIFDGIRVKLQERFIQDVNIYFTSEHFSTSLSGEYADNLLRRMKYSPVDIKSIIELDMIDIAKDDDLGDKKIAFYIILIRLQDFYSVNASEYDLSYGLDYFVNQLYFVIENIENEKFEKLQIQIEDEYYYLCENNKNISLEMINKIINERCK